MDPGGASRTGSCPEKKDLIFERSAPGALFWNHPAGTGGTAAVSLSPDHGNASAPGNAVPAGQKEPVTDLPASKKGINTIRLSKGNGSKSIPTKVYLCL